MANRFKKIPASTWISKSFGVIDENFEQVGSEIDTVADDLSQEVSNREELEQRVDTIINEPSPGKDAELVDVRTPAAEYTPLEPIDTAGGMTRDMQKQFVEHKAETVTQIFNVKTGFGAKGDGVADETLAIQRAIDAAAEVGGGVVYIPSGNYLISDKLIVRKPIIIIGQGKGSDTSNANSGSAGVTTLRWVGEIGGTMFEFKSDSVGNYLYGVGLIGCHIDGNNIATTAIHGASICESEFKSLVIRRVAEQGILIDGGNDVLSKHNIIEDYHFVYGAQEATRGAHGLVLGNETDGLTTQTHVISMNGLVYNGHLIYVKGSDNNIFDKVHGVTQSGGGGRTVYLKNGVKSARNNVFNYLVGGVHAESQTYGNRILHYISEHGGITVDEGAQLHYTVEDYVNSGVFETHKYVMSDQKDIPIGSLSILEGATSGIAAAQWPCIDLPNGVNSRVGVSLPPIYSWNNGTIQKLRIWYTTDTANTDAEWVARIRASTRASLTGLATPEFNEIVSMPVSNANNVSRYYDVDLELAFVKEDAIYLSIQRLGADENDTASGKIQILGASLIYQNIGPRSGGSGTYDVTSPGF